MTKCFDYLECGDPKRCADDGKCRQHEASLPKRILLTNEQIDSLKGGSSQTYREFARAIEAASFQMQEGK